MVVRTEDIRGVARDGTPLVARVEARDVAGPAGRPLGEWVAQEGWVFLRGAAPLSLEAWRDHDPVATRLTIDCLSMDAALYDRHHAAGRDPFDAVRGAASG